jgi:hypothetical protein
MTSEKPRVKLEDFEDPLDVFHFAFGILRGSIKVSSPQTWKALLKPKR